MQQGYLKKRKDGKYTEDLVIHKRSTDRHNSLLTYRFRCSCFAKRVFSVGSKDLLLFSLLIINRDMYKTKGYYFYHFSRRIIAISTAYLFLKNDNNKPPFDNLSSTVLLVFLKFLLFPTSFLSAIEKISPF